MHRLLSNARRSAGGSPLLVSLSWPASNFLNRDSRITDYQEMPSSNPRLQGEIHIAWWVDDSCSGIEYAANIGIVGP